MRVTSTIDLRIYLLSAFESCSLHLLRYLLLVPSVRSITFVSLLQSFRQTSRLSRLRLPGKGPLLSSKAHREDQ